MDLFPANPGLNLLPCDGIVNDHGRVLNQDQADHFFTALMERIPWRNDEVVIYGRRIVTARRVAWFGDDHLTYSYSGTTKHPAPWIPELRALKALIEDITGATFNSCLANLYENGTQGMAWHSDDEKSMRREHPIASLSLGAERKFSFKHKNQPLRQSLVLPHGGLLVMRGATQEHWLHSLPPSTRILAPRINLTFRIMATP